MNLRTVASVFACSVVAALLAGGCGFGGDDELIVGVVDDAARSGETTAFLDELTASGFGAVAVSSFWQPGRTEPDATEADTLTRVATAAEARDIRLFVIVYHVGSATTPLTPEARSEFAAYAAAIAGRLEPVEDLIIGNEPNLNRFWLPQFGPDGRNASAPAYLSLLAETYDAVKEARSDVRIWGGTTAPRGSDRADAPRATSSPTAFIRALGEAYRSSGRDEPVMDGYVHHPYPESARVPIDLPHPNVTTIGLADHGKLATLLEEAFDGTAQEGSELPILYGEVGVETEIPADKAGLYGADEPVPTISESEQAAVYRRVLELASCQPHVAGVLFFHLRDEPSLTGWQSGVRYADGTPKASDGPVRADIAEATAGELPCET